MVRALLAERFALTAHAESRQLPVYLLTRVGGQQSRGLTRSGPECAPLTMPSGIPMPPPPPPSMTGIPLSVTRTPLRCPTIFALGSIGHVSARAITMDGFASALVGAVQRPVIDQTGLTGEFDIDLTYGSALEALPAGSPVDFSPVLFTAIREQLGLKLENARAPVQVLVIERVQRPTEN
jgi:uncharacterized protein (TIGR03435 family)